MKFELAPLSYAKDALAPYISAKTLDVHYERHHRGYLDKLETAITGTACAKGTLEQLIWESEGDVFNLAAQVWNHTFYFDGMRPGGGGKPSGRLALQIERDFGSYAHFCHAFSGAANEQFGSGWAWLALTPRGKLEVIATCDADNPLRHGIAPLLTLDVWEHAYYLDYQSDRSAYVEGFLAHLIDWRVVAARFTEHRPPAPIRKTKMGDHSSDGACTS